MFSISNDEIENLPPLGDEILCPHCKEPHIIEFGIETLPDGTKKESKSLAFYTCPYERKTYLAGIDGRSLMGRAAK